MTPIDQFTPEQVAKAFSKILKDWLSDGEQDLVLERNRNGSNFCCATHDFCDANQAFLDALCNLTGIPDVDVYDAMSTDLYNTAWSIARSNNFWFK